jgi:Lrp/AsnC family leucine-responsive transcriptional regulator
MAEPDERPLDRIDRRILETLQSDGRISNVALARRVNLSPTPCLERVRRLERAGYVLGYGARLDPARLGASLLVFVQVTLDRTTPDVFARFAEAIVRIPEVCECHMVAGGFDYLLKIRAADMAAYRGVLGQRLTAIPGVAQTHSYVVMEEVKDSRALPVPES